VLSVSERQALTLRLDRQAASRLFYAGFSRTRNSVSPSSCARNRSFPVRPKSVKRAGAVTLWLPFALEGPLSIPHPAGFLPLETETVPRVRDLISRVKQTKKASKCPFYGGVHLLLLATEHGALDLVNLRLARGRTRDRLREPLRALRVSDEPAVGKGGTHELLEHALVEGALGRPALVILLVVPLEAAPVRVKLLQAVLAHLPDPARRQRARSCAAGAGGAQVLRAARDAPALAQAVRGVARLGLAEHEVLWRTSARARTARAGAGRTVVVFAVRAKEEGGALERAARRAELGDGGDGLRQRRRVLVRRRGVARVVERGHGGRAAADTDGGGRAAGRGKPALACLLSTRTTMMLRLATRAVPRLGARRAACVLPRALHTTRPARGTTTLPNILAGGPAPAVVVRTLTPRGLQLDDGLIIPGACVFLDGEVLLWDAPSPGEWGALGVDALRARFELFEAVAPRPGMFFCRRVEGRC
jgi:hypothetical protein